jgi:hypothetical protein
MKMCNVLGTFTYLEDSEVRKDEKGFERGSR